MPAFDTSNSNYLPSFHQYQTNLMSIGVINRAPFDSATIINASSSLSSSLSSKIISPFHARQTNYNMPSLHNSTALLQFPTNYDTFQTNYRSSNYSSNAKSSQHRNEYYQSNSINTMSVKRTTTKVGHVSKTRVQKRTSEINLHKTCPGCFKLWRYCKCSNIKNRPDPKPYCKFVPPRMLKKKQQVDQASSF
jgi:hypothetical protein